MHKLLILGSLGEFVQLIEQAKARGITTIVCDGYAGSIGKQHADRSYDVDVGQIEEIARICEREQVDGIITSFSDYLFECMVKIAEAAHLKCYFDGKHLPYYRDKTKMKQMFTSLGIGTPAFTSVGREFADEELAGLRFPVVVKPIDKYGSRGVQVLDTIEEVRRQFDHTCETSEIKRILVEEYHDGYEFNMMSWVLDGKVQVISIADREKTSVGAHAIPISTRNVYPSRLMNHVYEEAKEILQKIADFTGQRQGALSMQFFWKPGTHIQVCEVAGRFFGYEHELVEYAGGLNIEKLLLDYVYEEEKLSGTFANYSPYFTKQSAVLYFHGRPGLQVVHQERAEALAEISGTVEHILFYKNGEKVVEHGPNPYVARYYITASDRKALDAITQQYFEQMSITDASGREVLYRNAQTEYED